MNKSKQNPPSILSNELRNHYEKHGVVGIESFIANKDSTASKSSASCKQSLNVLHNESNTHSSNNEGINYFSKDDFDDSYKSSRFVRFNPRFDEKETLELLCVSESIFTFCLWLHLLVHCILTPTTNVYVNL